MGVECKNIEICIKLQGRILHKKQEKTHTRNKNGLANHPLRVQTLPTKSEILREPKKQKFRKFLFGVEREL